MVHEETPILIERDGPIATVFLNRASKLNALHKPLWLGIGTALRDLSMDDSVRCVVVRGAGGKAFSPGADIAEFESERANPAQGAAYGEIMHETMMAVAECRHPTLALIEGVCVGAGLALALMCDLRICGESSRFGVPVNRLGVTMPPAELGALVRVAGYAVAMEILFEARVFGAAEARDKRLVTRVVPDSAVADETYTAARRIAEGAPLSNRWHKKIARRLADGRPLTPAERAEAFACFGTEDYREGVRAFMAKEKPVFEGK